MRGQPTKGISRRYRAGSNHRLLKRTGLVPGWRLCGTCDRKGGHAMFVRSLVAALSVLVAFTATPPADAETMLRVGMNLKGAPFSFHDDASGSDKGVSVDLV